MTAFSFRTDSRRPLGASPGRLLLSLAGGLAGIAVLSACASEPETRPCPQAVVLKDAARQVKFNGAGRDLTDVLFEAQIAAGRMVCEYDENELDVDLQVTVTAATGPANGDRLANIRYFVAVAQTNQADRTDQTVLARESFDIAIPFPGNRTRVSGLEEIGQIIQLPEGLDGGDYRIYVGLELSHEELEYNRANR